MRIHSAAALGFAVRSSEAADPGFCWAEAQWATLKRGDELVLVRAIGARPDGSLMGEVFGLDPEAPIDSNGIRLGDQIAFNPEHVWACDSGTHESDVSRQQSTEELRRADRLKEQFIAALAHEPRNPLSPITGTIRFLQAKAPSDLKFAIDLLERQSAQLRRLVLNLLDLARLQSGTLLLAKRRVDLAWVLHAAIEETRHLFEEKNQQFTDAYPQQRIELEADSARLTEAVSHLLSNASKCTAAGGRITLEIHRHAEAISIDVTDTGIGVPRSLHERIFEPFATTADHGERYEAAGIGLALVKGIVELHGGSVSVESEGPGKGSRFVVRLPCSRQLSAT